MMRRPLFLKAILNTKGNGHKAQEPNMQLVKHFWPFRYLYLYIGELEVQENPSLTALLSV